MAEYGHDKDTGLFMYYHYLKGKRFPEAWLLVAVSVQLLIISVEAHQQLVVKYRKMVASQDIEL